MAFPPTYGNNLNVIGGNQFLHQPTADVKRALFTKSKSTTIESANSPNLVPKLGEDFADTALRKRNDSMMGNARTPKIAKNQTLGARKESGASLAGRIPALNLGFKGTSQRNLNRRSVLMSHNRALQLDPTGKQPALSPTSIETIVQT